MPGVAVDPGFGFGKTADDNLRLVRFEQAAQHDDLAHTVDYEQVYRVARQVVTENQFYLIERLAYLIAHGVLETCPQARAVEVTVRKPNPPIGGPADRAEVVYRVARP